MSRAAGWPDNRRQIRNAILAAIQKAETAAVSRVFGPRDLPTAPNMMPCIIVSSPPRERSESLVKGQPSYETTGLFPVTARVAAKDITKADEQIEELVTQIKVAVFSYRPFLDIVERVTFVETSTELLSEGENKIAQVNIVFACEYPEFFYPAPGVPLQGIEGTIAEDWGTEARGSFKIQF